MPALLAELGLANQQLGTTGARPLIYSQDRLHPLPTGTLNGIPSSAESMAGLVNDATLGRIAAEQDQPLSWKRGADPAVGDLIADRFGEQVVARSVDPMLSGVYAGSAATIGLRAAAPTLAAASGRRRHELTDAVRQALTSITAGPVFGAVGGGYAVLVEELVRRSRIDWVQAAVDGIDAAAQGWTLRDDAGAEWRADAVIFAVPAAARPTGRPPSPRAPPRQRAGSQRRPRWWWPWRCRAASIPAELRCAGGQRRTVARQGDYVVLAKMGSARRRGALATFVRAFRRDLATRASDDELLAWALEDLATVFGLTVEPVDVHVQRWPDAMPQYGPGHRDLVTELRAGLPPTCR